MWDYDLQTALIEWNVRYFLPGLASGVVPQTKCVAGYGYSSWHFPSQLCPIIPKELEVMNQLRGD